MSCPPASSLEFFFVNLFVHAVVKYQCRFIIVKLIYEKFSSWLSDQELEKTLRFSRQVPFSIFHEFLRIYVARWKAGSVTLPVDLCILYAVC